MLSKYLLPFAFIIGLTLLLLGMAGSLTDPAPQASSLPDESSSREVPAVGVGPAWPMPSESARAAFRERRERFYSALRTVEGGNRPGDLCESYGPYQIGKLYFRDAIEGTGLPWRWPADVLDRDKAEYVILLYMRRWAPESVDCGDYWRLAALHSGGPNGDWKLASIDYASRVVNLMGVAP